MMRKLCVTMAIVVACSIVSSTVNTASAAETDSEVDTSTTMATGQAQASLFGATAQGYYVAAVTTQRCPSVRDPAMPPCTSWAGGSGAYSAGAYVCVAGMGKYKGHQYPSLRTCMDGYILFRHDQISSTIKFYANDLYKYWNYAQQQVTLWWNMVALYVTWWQYNATYMWEPYVCILLAASVTGGELVSTLAGYACGTALGVVKESYGY